METLLFSIPAFLFALGVIVFVHEFGHYIVAKFFGVRVLVFSLGFGKRLWGFHRNGTDYRIAWVPLGGYVRMAGELPDERLGAPDDFLSKPRWQRILVYLAGPAMNVVLSIALIAGVFMHGIQMQALQDIPSIVGDVVEGSAAEAAGLLPGDQIIRVDGKPVEKWKAVAFAFATAPEKPVAVEVIRQEQSLELIITPTKAPKYEYGEAGAYPQLLLRMSEIFRDAPADQAGFLSGDEILKVDGRNISGVDDFVTYIGNHADQEISITVRRRGEELTLALVPENIEGKGRIGVILGSYRRLPFTEAVVESIGYNLEIVQQSVFLLGKLFTQEIAPKSALSGPIEIAAWSGRAARRGFTDLLYTMGFLSISIGFMNLLPIPILDGGHILILLIESLLRRDLSLAVKERATQVGFMLLMTLMAMVIFFDLSKNLPSLFAG